MSVLKIGYFNHEEILLKKAGLVFLAISLIFLAIGCASSGNAVLLADRAPIALVSMVSNGYINWQDDPIDPKQPAGFFTDRNLRRDPDLILLARADDLINTAESMFRDAVAASPLINLAERDEVLFSGAYQNAQLRRAQDMVKPDDYRFVNSKDKAFLSALAGETGIQRCMFVEFVFSKKMTGGLGKNGYFRAELTMKVSVLDAQGKSIFRDSYSLWSDSTIRVSGSLYSESEVMELFESALGDVYREFLLELSL